MRTLSHSLSARLIYSFLRSLVIQSLDIYIRLVLIGWWIVLNRDQERISIALPIQSLDGSYRG